VHKIGEGTFGKVYKAQYTQVDGTIKQFALKKMNMILDEQNDQGFPLTSLREIKYLSILDNENVVKLK
jgi:serine/threonine protein kinase